MIRSTRKQIKLVRRAFERSLSPLVWHGPVLPPMTWLVCQSSELLRSSLWPPSAYAVVRAVLSARTRVRLLRAVEADPIERWISVRYLDEEHAALAYKSIVNL